MYMNIYKYRINKHLYVPAATWELWYSNTPSPQGSSWKKKLRFGRPLTPLGDEVPFPQAFQGDELKRSCRFPFMLPKCCSWSGCEILLQGCAGVFWLVWGWRHIICVEIVVCELDIDF